eukprot:1235712-Rhodomonas_salina.2
MAAMCGTDTAYGATSFHRALPRGHHRSAPFSLPADALCGAIFLGMRYAMSGTDIGYGAGELLCCFLTLPLIKKGTPPPTR